MSENEKIEVIPTEEKPVEDKPILDVVDKSKIEAGNEVLRMALADRDIQICDLQLQLKAILYDSKIAQLKQERQNFMQEFTNKKNEATKKLFEMRKSIEEKFNIDVKDYAYEEETGTLRHVSA